MNKFVNLGVKETKRNYCSTDELNNINCIANHPVRCAGAGSWCWSGVRGKYCWLAGGWMLVLEWCERKILLDWLEKQPSEQGELVFKGG